MTTAYRARDAAMQFPLRHPAVASVVCGLRTSAQVHSAVDRLKVEIDESTWDELDRCVALDD